jgi:hypothetical protein
LLKGLWNGLFWGLIMYLFVWSSGPQYSLNSIIFSISFAGVSFGLVSAVTFKIIRKRHQLTTWEEFS